MPACSHVPRVRVPGIKWEATSRRVLTMEWIDGVKLTDEKGKALLFSQLFATGFLVEDAYDCH